MAGRGRAPKDVADRRNHHAPQRGEWIELSALTKPALPSLPKGEWSERTKRAWKAWGEDPATGEYGASEVQSALDLAYVYEEWVSKGGSSIAAEIRQRLDGLGLTPKGKRDLRWRTPGEAAIVAAQGRPAEVRRLRVVAQDAVAGS